MLVLGKHPDDLVKEDPEHLKVLLFRESSKQGLKCTGCKNITYDLIFLQKKLLNFTYTVDKLNDKQWTLTLDSMTCEDCSAKDNHRSQR